MIKTGILYGIGVGPGDPELITLKGFRILNECPVIAYPEARKGAGSYAKTIIGSLIKEDQKDLLPLTFPMTKDTAILEKEWNNSVASILFHLNSGKNVVFVSEGDPLFYSTFIHLMQKIKQEKPDLEIKIIPGISALHGAAASLGWGLVTADQKFAVIPATENVGEMESEIDNHDTVVFYKAAKVIESLIEILKEKKLLAYSAAVSRATSEDEKIYLNLENIPEDGIPYLSLVIVRKPYTGSSYE
jgi:precorrin-2/cobalt-factor-2 C20-methyltransferase